MLKILVLMMTIAPFTAAAQEGETCQTLAAGAARQVAARIAGDQGIVIPAITSDAVVADIAMQVCAMIAPAETERVSEIASTASSAYFESAVKLGKSTEVAALVEGAIDRTLGLGLDDLRRYGVLTVSCASQHAGVEVRGSVTRCGNRVLLDRGGLQITVRDAAVALCEAATTLAERQELVCDCVALTATPGVPLKMACR
jgi:hypothetical protein